jgi:class 3 adenylate cyclase
MSFIDSVRRAQTLLQEEQRISLRVLQRELDLDADTMDALVEELVDIRGVAVRDGKALASAHPVSPPESQIGPPSTEGQRRQLTVLFCDLIGSTELAAQMDPEDWCTVMAVYQHAAAAVVE